MTSTTIQGSCQLDYLTQAELFNVSIFFFFDERALLSVKTPHVSLISWELTIQWKFSVANVKRNLIISSFKSFLMNKMWSRSQIPSPKGRKADDKIFLNISVQVVSIYSLFWKMKIKSFDMENGLYCSWADQAILTIFPFWEARQRAGNVFVMSSSQEL